MVDHESQKKEVSVESLIWRIVYRVFLASYVEGGWGGGHGGLWEEGGVAISRAVCGFLFCYDL